MLAVKYFPQHHKAGIIFTYILKRTFNVIMLATTPITPVTAVITPLIQNLKTLGGKIVIIVAKLNYNYNFCFSCGWI